ncbi:MAG: hypothetical protein Q9219_007560 [cf. Caloplaca sp. 3 TL-2023]
MLSIKCLLLMTLLLAFSRAYYLSPNPWNILPTKTLPSLSTPTSPLTTAAAQKIFPRQVVGGSPNKNEPKTVYANGQFLDETFASLFGCSSSSPPSPSPSPSPSPDPDDAQPGTAPPPPPPPSPTPTPITECNTADHIIDVDFAQEEQITIFPATDAEDLFEDQCGRKKQHYPVHEHKDHQYAGFKKVRLTMDARSNLPGGLRGDEYTVVSCRAGFGTVLKDCGELGGQTVIDDVRYQLYAFILERE